MAIGLRLQDPAHQRANPDPPWLATVGQRQHQYPLPKSHALEEGETRIPCRRTIQCKVCEVRASTAAGFGHVPSLAVARLWVLHDAVRSARQADRGSFQTLRRSLASLQEAYHSNCNRSKSAILKFVLIEARRSSVIGRAVPTNFGAAGERGSSPKSTASVHVPSIGGSG